MSFKSSVLYRIVRRDDPGEHYVFGTMHLNNEDAYTHADLAKKYIQSTDYYYAEMDLFAAEQNSLIHHFLLPEGQTLKDLFLPRHYQKIERIISKSFNIDISLLDRFIPFQVQTMLSESLLRGSNAAPLDYYLWKFASEEGKNMGGVESLDAQIKVLQQIPSAYQIKSLKSVCKNVQTFKQKMETLSNAYRKGDVQLIYRLSKKQTGSLRKLLIEDRNIYMGQKIFDSLSLGPSFFAVGAGHLYGNTGVLAALKRQKCKVTAVYE